MLLSVVMPTYNGARFLRDQIGSILAQTVTDFELLAIDDGSSDATLSILDDVARRDSRVRRLPSGGNRGQNRRLVELLAVASGEFVAIADQDDVWQPDRNEKLLDVIDDRVLACARSQLIDGEGADLGLSILEAKGVDAAAIGPLRGLFEPLVSAHAAIFRRSWIDMAAFYGPLPFDLALGVEALFSGGLVYVDDAVVRHRIHGGNQMNGRVVPSGYRHKPISRHRAKVSLGKVRSRRVILYRTLDQLGRSGALTSEVRSVFRHLADTCWNVWFGIGGRPRTLEADFLRCLAHFAGSPEDLAFFEQRVRSLTQPWFAPANVADAWRYYRNPID